MAGKAFSRSFAAFLDLSRALAATMVLLVHLRDPLFRGWSALDPSEQTPLVRLWFFFGGMGFEAVVVFFVLSGFLVGGIGWGKVRAGSFTLRGYSIDRVSRLFVVFIPALLLTVALDRLGARWFGELGYWNATNPVMASKFPDFGTTGGASTFACNLAMLQPFYCRAYGSNIPLWSLSYEFWFYIVFGLGVAVVSSRGARRIALAAGVLAVFALLGSTFLLLLIAWGFGVVAYLVDSKRAQWPILSALLFAVLTCASRLMQGPEFGTAFLPSLITMLQAAAFAWVVVSMRGVQSRLLEWLSDFSKGFAGFSYTLYLIHFPLMLFVLGVMAWIVGKGPFLHGLSPASAQGVAVYLGAFAAVMALSWGFARLTEAHTQRLRNWLKGRLVRVGETVSA